MTDRLAYWNARRRGEKPTWSDSAPQDGFYRLRRVKDGPWLPVAIYEVEGEQIVVVEGDESDSFNRDWRSCAERDISYEAYEQRLRLGKWPGEVETPGGNAANMSPVEALSARITDDKEWLAANPKLTSRLEADEAANRKGQLALLKGKVVAVHDEEKAPHWAECKRIDDAYLPTAKKADPVLAALQKRIDEFDAAERERLRKEQARTLHTTIEKALTEPPPAAVPPARYGTGLGRAVKAKPLPKAFQIANAAALVAFLGDDPDFVAQLNKFLMPFAERAVAAGITCPGVELIESAPV